MDANQVLLYARELLAWVGPLVAEGALAKIGENTTDRTTQLFVRAWRSLQAWLACDEGAVDDLRKLEKQPENTNRQQLVAEALAQIAACDTAVAMDLEILARELAALKGNPSSRTHQISISDNAQVGQAIAGDVQGNINLSGFTFDNRRTALISGTRPALSPIPTTAARLPINDRTLSADGVHFSYGHALLIGVGDYTAGAAAVPTTVADAEALGDLLRNVSIAGYPSDQVRIVSNEQATRDGILQALDTFAQCLATAVSRAPHGLTTLLFFAGHGERRGEDYVLLASDGKSITAAEVHEKVATVRQHSQRLVVLLNCCHSGGVAHQTLGKDDGDAAGDPPPPSFYLPLVAGSGHVVMSASKPEQKAGAISQINSKHTVFGMHLLDALRGKVGGSGLGIGVFELFEYLATHIPADAHRIIYRNSPLAQCPLFYAQPVEQNFALALRPGGSGDTLGPHLATEITQLAVLEAELARYMREADAPPSLVRQRNALLAKLEI